MIQMVLKENTRDGNEHAVFKMSAYSAHMKTVSELK